MRRLLLPLLVLLAVAPAWAANEQRCNDLGPDCICAERFNTATYTNVGTNWQDPADSTALDKQCTLLTGTPNATVESQGRTHGPGNKTSILAKLPAGNSVSFYLRTQEGSLDSLALGYFPTGGGSKQRYAMRWYAYHSSTTEGENNYIFPFENGSSGCTNGKIAQMPNANPSFIVTQGGNGDVSLYNFTASGGTWSPQQDCCVSGPTIPGNQTSKADWRGQWVRLEQVLGPVASGSQPRMRLYYKNVTTNGPEREIITFDQVNGNYASPSLVYPKTTSVRMDRPQIDYFRNVTAPVGIGCQGWRGMVNFMIAAWNTDAGQRIGAACEVEPNDPQCGGGGGPTQVPATPTNLTVTPSGPAPEDSYGACLVLLAMLVASALHAGRRRA